MNLRQGIARLEFAVRTPDREIDDWMMWAYDLHQAVVLESIDDRCREDVAASMS